MKPAISYHAAAVPHPEIRSGYWSQFFIIGKPPQWVVDAAGSRRIFATKEEAELAGYRAMVYAMNTVSASLSRPRRSEAVRTEPRPMSEAAKVFARFKGSDTTDR